MVRILATESKQRRHDDTEKKRAFPLADIWKKTLWKAAMSNRAIHWKIHLKILRTEAVSSRSQVAKNSSTSGVGGIMASIMRHCGTVGGASFMIPHVTLIVADSIGRKIPLVGEDDRVLRDALIM